MNSKRHTVLSRFLVVLIGCTFINCDRNAPRERETNAGVDNERSLRIEAHQKGSGSPILEMRLTNVSATPIVMHEYRLPWRNRYSLLVLIVPDKAPDQPLRMAFAADDPALKTLVIRPGETIRGELDLRDRFVDINTQVKKGSILHLFWEYDLLDLKGRIVERQFGGCTLQ